MRGISDGTADQASADSFRSQAVDCAHLHSAFGPGCPYCEKAVTRAAPGHPVAGSSYERPDHELDLGAVA